jgi:hypothetical protein
MRLPRASRYVASNLLVLVDLKYCSSALSVGAFVPCWAWKNDNIRLFVFVFVFVFPATGDSKAPGEASMGKSVLTPRGGVHMVFGCTIFGMVLHGNTVSRSEF